MALDLDELLLKLKWEEEGQNLPAGARAQLQNLIQAQQALAQTTAAGVAPTQAAAAATGAAAARTTDLGAAVQRTTPHLMGAGRGAGLLRTAMTGLALQATATQGPVGRLAATLLMFGAGSSLVTGVAAGVALVAGAYRVASAEATKLRDQTDRLNLSYRTITGAGKPLVAMREDLTKATKELADAEGTLARLAATRAPGGRFGVGGPGAGVGMASEGDVALAQGAVDAARRQVAALTGKRTGLVQESVQDWVSSFLDGLKDLRLDDQLAQLTANRGEFERRGTEAAAAWQRAFMDVMVRMPPIRPVLGGDVRPGVNAQGQVLFQRIGTPGGAAAGTGPVFNQQFEQFIALQAQGAVILRSLVTPQQQFNQALEILRQSVEFGALTADERAAAEKRLSDAMGVTTKKSQVLGVAIISAVSGAIAAVIQGGSPGGIIGGILGTVGGIVGIGNPLLGAGIAGLGTIISATGNRGVTIDRYGETALGQLRGIPSGPERIEFSIISATTGEVIERVIQTLGNRRRVDAVPRVPLILVSA